MLQLYEEIFEITSPDMWPELEKLVDPEHRGYPMSELQWTRKSTAKLSDRPAGRRPQ